MRCVFIVQGEGRGHLTQSITLERLLRERGHEVVKILVGRSPSRELPDFFLDAVSAPVARFDSVNFMPSAANRRPNMVKTVFYNSAEMHKYLPSLQFIRDEIRASEADLVVNFYELMAGMTYFFYKVETPMVCIGHQYLFLHEDFDLPRHKYPSSVALDFFTRLTAFGSSRTLALSFREMRSDEARNIVVVPPLLRREVQELKSCDEGYVHGYMLNAGFAEDVLEWHKAHPEVELRFFWDRKGEGKVKPVDDTLSFWQLDDREFLRQMSGCHAYASTAGFESICEAMWLGKPVLMVPSHIEQEVNAYDASRSGVGVVSDRFDIGRLMDFAENYVPDEKFRKWASEASGLIISELENVAD